MEREGLTTGYTSILYRTPDEDVGFWYTNIKSSITELERMAPSATQLERSNLLMKLRETLLDQGGSGKTKVTIPRGIIVYPNNMVVAFMGWLSAILVVAGVVIVVSGKDF